MSTSFKGIRFLVYVISLLLFSYIQRNQKIELYIKVWNRILQNKLLYSNVLQSKVFQSKVFQSNVFKSNVFQSKLFKREMFQSNVLQSGLLKSKVFQRKVFWSKVLYQSKVIKCKVFQSNVLEHDCNIYVKPAMARVQGGVHQVQPRGLRDQTAEAGAPTNLRDT